MSTQVNSRLQDGSVYLIAANDVTALEQAIIHLWENPAQRTALQKNSKRLAASFGWDNIAAEIVTWIVSGGQS